MTALFLAMFGVPVLKNGEWNLINHLQGSVWNPQIYPRYLYAIHKYIIGPELSLPHVGIVVTVLPKCAPK